MMTSACSCRKLAYQPLFLGIGQIGRRQGIACAGNQLEKGVCRDLLKDILQSVNPSFNKIRQRAGRVEHAEQNMSIRATHVQIRQDDPFALLGQ